jgi:hypothetical protein
MLCYAVECKLCDFTRLRAWEDTMVVRFTDMQDRVLIPVTNICKYVLNCPGCGQVGLCTGYYFQFIGMPEPLAISVYSSNGDKINSEITNDKVKNVKFRTKAGENYYLLIRQTDKANLGKEYTFSIKNIPYQ